MAFGDALGAVAQAQEFSWAELPGIDDVYSSLKKQAQIKARLRVAKLELEIYQAKMTQAKPRTTSVKLVGVDEQSEVRLYELLLSVANLESELDELDAEVKFNEYRREAAKIISYKQRI